ncbi:hypothetical protein QBC33DRAFT_460907, partial [Phialemonium atrogriseum]
AYCFTQSYRNFGFITTSLAKSNNSFLKTYSLLLQSDLPKVKVATARQTRDKAQLCKEKIIAAYTIIWQLYGRREWLGKLPLTVTW